MIFQEQKNSIIVIPKIHKELFITHPTNFKSVVTLSNP